MSNENQESAIQQPQPSPEKKKSFRRQSCNKLYEWRTQPPPISVRRANRGLKPRNLWPCEVDSEIMFGAPDSRSIWQANRNKTLAELSAKDTWETSAAQEKLNSLSVGLWIPAWVARVTAHPTRARILAWLLDRFDDINSEINRCRAYLTDESGDHWWPTSMAKIAIDTILGHKVEGSIRQLHKAGLIELVSQGSAGTLIRPLGKALILAYYKATSDEAAHDELKLADDGLQWHESSTHRRIWSTPCAGVRVSDAIMVICDRKPGPAALLSHIIYWHSKERSRITRNGQLWCAKSTRNLATETGYSRGALDKWCKSLCVRGFLARDYWVWDRRTDYNQKTLHLRPVPCAIEQALIDHECDIQQSLSQKHH